VIYLSYVILFDKIIFN